MSAFSGFQICNGTRPYVSILDNKHCIEKGKTNAVARLVRLFTDEFQQDVLDCDYDSLTSACEATWRPVAPFTNMV